jgi:hypothetical protein
MHESWTIPVYFGTDKLNLQGSMSRADESVAGVVAVDGSKLQASLSSVMSKLDLLLAGASREVKNFNVAGVKVSLTLDTSGEVSILGIAKASAGSKGTIEVTFAPRSV